MIISRGRSKTAGLSLISALVSLFILTTAMTIVLQTYTVGARAARLSAQRNAATLALEARLETLRAGGYANLPAAGLYPIHTDALPTLDDVSGELAVVPGALPDTRQLTASVTWESGGPRQEQLTMLMVKRGMNP